MNTETWYVMEDGSCGDPREIAAGADGVLRHKDGRAVEYKPHGPRTRGVNVDEERAKSQPKLAKAPAKARDMKPEEQKPEEQKPGYVTRESKAE